MKPIRWLRRGLALTTLGAAGGAAVITVRHLLATPQPLENRLFGDITIDHRPEGDIYYNVAGPHDAEPFVLLHDFYPGASNFEFRRLYPRLAADYRVYALDWLGFGLSERPALAYTGEFYAHLLNGFLRDRVGRPANVLAHGLAANVAARAAADDPTLYARLVLVEPRPLARTLPGPTLRQTLVRAMQRASLGLVPYAILATRPALRWQLGRHAAHGGEGAATDDALDHVYASAHQFGGHHALLALLMGELDLPIENAFALLEPPVLIVSGAGDGQRSSAGLQDLALLNPRAETAAIGGAGDSVYEDQPAAVMDQLNAWLHTPHGRATPSVTESYTGTRFPAGSLRVTEGAERVGETAEAPESSELREMPNTPAATSAEPPATPTPPVTPTRDSAQLQPPGASVARDEPLDDEGGNWSTEQFGEPLGLVSASPHLDALEGLEEQAPEATVADHNAAQSREQERTPEDAATEVIGKPTGEVETWDNSEPSPTSAEPPVTTSPRQPSESTTRSALPATKRDTPASVDSAAPASGERSVHSQPRPQKGAGSAGTSGKSSRRAAGGSSGSTGSGGRKSSSHRPKKS